MRRQVSFLLTLFKFVRGEPCLYTAEMPITELLNASAAELGSVTPCLNCTNDEQHIMVISPQAVALPYHVTAVALEVQPITSAGYLKLPIC